MALCCIKQLKHSTQNQETQILFSLALLEILLKRLILRGHFFVNPQCPRFSQRFNFANRKMLLIKYWNYKFLWGIYFWELGLLVKFTKWNTFFTVGNFSTLSRDWLMKLNSWILMRCNNDDDYFLTSNSSSSSLEPKMSAISSFSPSLK